MDIRSIQNYRQSERPLWMTSTCLQAFFQQNPIHFKIANCPAITPQQSISQIFFNFLFFKETFNCKGISSKDFFFVFLEPSEILRSAEY